MPRRNGTPGAEIGVPQMKTPELPAFSVFQSIDSSKLRYFFTPYRMSPPEGSPGVRPGAVKTFMAWSSMVQFAGMAVPLH